MHYGAFNNISKTLTRYENIVTQLILFSIILKNMYKNIETYYLFPML